MPIGAINWNNATKTLCLRGAGPLRGTSGYFAFRKVSNDISVDDSPIVDESTNPWTVTFVNEIALGKLTGNPTAKKAKLIQWFNQYVFQNIIPLADLAVDDPDKTIDPDSPREFWGDENGIKQAPFDHYVSQANELTDLDDTALSAEIISGNIERVA